jgi:molybdate transport system substrate-binding protein
VFAITTNGYFTRLKVNTVEPLPAELQNITVYSGGIHSGTKEPAAATALVKFLTAALAIPTLKKHGLEPG